MPKSARPPEFVFLNLPFDKEYEAIFIAYIVGLLTVGFIPRSVLELGEDGSGRMERLFALMKKCKGSVHDLSYSGTQRRYNMPFELGVAYALAKLMPKRSLYVFEEKRHSLGKDLSDLSHFDPKFHHRRGEKALTAIYDCFDSPKLVDPMAVGLPIYRNAITLLPKLRQHHKTIFNRTSLRLLVSVVTLWRDDALKSTSG